MSAENGYLDPTRVRLFREPQWTLRMTIEGDRSYVKAKVVKVAPLSLPGEYISFLDSKDKQIGMLKSLEGLDEVSRAIVQEELDKRYLTFVVHKIKSVLSEFGISYWEVETDRGTKDFVVRDVSENVLRPGPSRVVIVDVEGNRFEIADTKGLDKKSAALMNSVL